MHLSWTPPGEEALFLGVTLREREDLTRERYLGRLSSRIEKMLREASKEDRRLFNRLALESDLVELPDSPMMAADLLLESETLQAMLPEMPKAIPAAKLKDDPEIAQEIEETDLQDWMARLYQI